MKLKRHVEIIDGEEETYFTQTMNKYVSGTKDKLHFNCLICPKHVIGGDDECNNYVPHPATWGICLNFRPEENPQWINKS